MLHSARSMVHPALDSTPNIGNTVVILGKVRRMGMPWSQSLALVLLQPSGLFCVLEGASLPGPFYPSVSGSLVYCLSKPSLNLLPQV